MDEILDGHSCSDKPRTLSEIYGLGKWLRLNIRSLVFEQEWSALTH